MKRLLQGLGSFWLVRACSSSIGKKFVMAVTGLALCGFLVVHLGGNLLLYVGAEKYNHYAHALHAQEILLLIAEVGLFAMFIGHIVLAVATGIENNAARPTDYLMRQSKQEQGPLAAPASSVMFATGIVVLLFLILHLADFKFEARLKKDVQDLEPFAKALVYLRDPISAAVYIVGSLVLGYHVLHGFQSAFHTLGFNHPKYTPTIKFLSFVFAAVVALGFASFPFWAWAVKIES